MNTRVRDRFFLRDGITVDVTESPENGASFWMLKSSSRQSETEVSLVQTYTSLPEVQVYKSRSEKSMLACGYIRVPIP